MQCIADFDTNKELTLLTLIYAGFQSFIQFFALKWQVPSDSAYVLKSLGQEIFYQRIRVVRMTLGLFTPVLENHFQGEPPLWSGWGLGRDCVIYSSGIMILAQSQNCQGKKLIPGDVNDWSKVSPPVGSRAPAPEICLPDSLSKALPVTPPKA